MKTQVDNWSQAPDIEEVQYHLKGSDAGLMYELFIHRGVERVNNTTCNNWFYIKGGYMEALWDVFLGQTIFQAISDSIKYLQFVHTRRVSVCFEMEKFNKATKTQEQMD